jgi:hypothetical protein
MADKQGDTEQKVEEESDSPALAGESGDILRFLCCRLLGTPQNCPYSSRRASRERPPAVFSRRHCDATRGCERISRNPTPGQTGERQGPDEAGAAQDVRASLCPESPRLPQKTRKRVDSLRSNRKPSPSPWVKSPGRQKRPTKSWRRAHDQANCPKGYDLY